jgi:hypothetical protein
MNIGEQVILRLNTSALNALFPEGTEARVQLQSAVLAEAAGKFVKGQLTEQVTGALKAHVDEATKKIDAEGIMESLFERKGWQKVLEVREGGGLAVAIKAKVEQVFKDHVETRMVELIEERLTKWQDGMEPSIQKMVDYKVQTITRDTLNAKVNEAFAAAGLAPVK